MKKALVILLSIMLVAGTFSASFAGPKADKEIKWDKEKGVPRFVRGQLSEKEVKTEKDVKEFLKVNKDMFKLQGDEYKVKKVEKDDLGMTHYRTQYAIDGIPVYGAEMMVHTDENGKVYALNGEAEPTVPVKKFKTNVKLSEADALAAAEKAIDLKLKPFVADEKLALETVNEERYTAEPTTELYLMEVKNQWKPVYIVKLSFVNPYPAYWHIFVDAKTGEVIKKNNEVRYDGPTTGYGYDVLGNYRTLNTYLSSGYYYLYDTTKPMSGVIRTMTAQNGTSLPGSYMVDTGNTFYSSSQEAGVSAHYNAEKTYDYYYNTHGRNSFDNNGANITSTVHYSSNYNNAFWNGSQMVYGDGDGYTFIPLSGGLDIVAHEITHAVTSYTADLAYHNQSGALNETFSDVFGVIVEGDTNDWLVGEDVYTPGTSGDALRSMKNPELYNQPAHMNDYQNLPDTQAGDWGGVHINSGITNKAFYHIASDIGFAKAGNIYYRALTVYLTSTSDFADGRDALEQATIDLYGYGSELTAVQNGHSNVGIY